jgi:uncharacterized membrane protein
VFTAAAIAILAVGSCTSAFSPILSPQATTMLQRQSMTLPTALRLAPVRMSKLENAEEESSSANSTQDKTPMMTTTEQKQEKKFMNPTPVLVSMLNDALNRDDTTNSILDTTTKIHNNKSLQMTNLKWVAATAAAFALAFLPLQDADAAMSGGRMGGSFSAPRQTMSRLAPMRSSSSYNRGYSSGGYMSRPGVTIAPGMGYVGQQYASPFYSPFAGPRFYGGAGVMAVSRGPSFFDLLFFGGCLFAVSQAFSQNNNSATESWTSSSSSVDGLGGWGSSAAQSALGPGTSVVQLSVALDVPDRDDTNSILGALDRLSRTARTDSRVGIQNLSSQVALEILRKRSSIVSASTSTKHFSNREKALREFNNRSIQERSKFETETVSKYGGVDYASPVSIPSKNGGKATMAVITLVLAIDGDSTKLNKINSMSDVEQALQKIASDSKVGDCLQSAEILWTPEDRTETISVRDVVADYPELRSI